MTFSTGSSFTVIFILVHDGFPISGMGIHLPTAVALDTDIRIRMTRFAGLQVPSRFGRVIQIPVIYLRGASRPV
jgi:hypothetical protein